MNNPIPPLDPRMFPNETNIRDIKGFIRTLTEAEHSRSVAGIPRNFFEQVYITTSGASTSLYIYNTSTTSWLSTSLA